MGGERGEQTARVEDTNEARRAEGASRLRGGAARPTSGGRGARRRRKTHKDRSSVSSPIASGMVPLISLVYKVLWMCAWRECEGGTAR